MERNEEVTNRVIHKAHPFQNNPIVPLICNNVGGDSGELLNWYSLHYSATANLSSNEEGNDCMINNCLPMIKILQLHWVLLRTDTMVQLITVFTLA